MADVTHTQIDEMDAIEGFFEGIMFHKAAAGLDVSSFGMAIVDLAPGAEDYPEHDHSAEGIGGQMFAKRPSSSARRRSTSPSAARARSKPTASSTRSTPTTSPASALTSSARSLPAPTASACWRSAPPPGSRTRPAARCSAGAS